MCVDKTFKGGYGRIFLTTTNMSDIQEYFLFLTKINIFDNKIELLIFLGIVLIISIILIILGVTYDRKKIKKLDPIFKSKGLIFGKLKPPYTFRNDIRIPSRKLWNKGILSFPIKSRLNRNLLIFKWQSGGSSYLDYLNYSWVFSYRIEGRSLPVFILKPKKLFLDNEKTAVHIDKSFDEKYLFVSTGKYDEEDEKKIKNIFKDINLQTIIFSNLPICIECNGVEIFYYRENDKSKLEIVPQILDDITELHNKIKEIKRDI